jgi:hypothetical protein
MNDWNKLDFVTDDDAEVVKRRTGWETVRFELADDEPSDDEESIARKFFLSLGSSG